MGRVKPAAVSDQISFFCRLGGKDCFSFSALALSAMTSVYKYLLQRILNFVSEGFFLILTDLASFLLAICKNCLISVICLGIAADLQRTIVCTELFWAKS